MKIYLIKIQNGHLTIEEHECSKTEKNYCYTGRRIPVSENGVVYSTTIYPHVSKNLSINPCIFARGVFENLEEGKEKLAKAYKEQLEFTISDLNRMLDYVETLKD